MTVSVRLSIDSSGFEEASARLAAMQERLPRAPLRIVEEAADIMDGALRLEAPKRTGRLAAGVEDRVEGGAFIASATFSDEAPYTPFVIEGTRPHRIQARIKQALWWEGAEHPVFAVNHPGTAANPFSERAFRDALPYIVLAVARLGRWIVNG